MDQELFLKAKTLAYKLLARRSRSVQELRDKLLAHHIPPEISLQVLRDLKKSRYLNDEDYARTWAQNRLNAKAYGPQRIEQELFHKGIPPEVVEKVMSEIYNNVDLVELAKKALRRKGERTDRDRKTRQRLYNYLRRRGFPGDIIEEVLSLGDEDPGEDLSG
jgi:regulatory protein